MKKIFYYAGIILFLSACSKDDDHTKDPEQTAKTCQLTKMSAQGAEINFIFNVEGYVVKKEIISPSGTDNYEYIYEPGNQLKTIIRTKGASQTSKKEFTYTNGLIAEIKTTSGNNTFIDTLIYDNNKRLVETRNKVTQNSFNSFYKYDNNGNLSEIESFTYNKLSYRSTYGNYDNKQNPYRTLKGNNIPNLDTELMELGQLMNNNPGFVKHVLISHLANGTIQETTDASNTYTYTYTENNYPAAITEKYKDGSEVTINLSYNCQ